MKGQWFLISAVIASGAFLMISVFLKSYFVVDPSKIALYDENFYLQNIKKQMLAVAKQSDCSNIYKNLNETKHYFETRMHESGFFLYLEPYNINCNAHTMNLRILLASEKMVVFENVLPESVLGQDWQKYPS